MKLKILTYATHSEGYYNILMSQLNKLKIDYEIIGYGKKWNGFFQKIKDIYEHLKTIDKNTIILFCDGFDSIVLENKKEIFKKYKSYGKKIVFGIEDLQNYLKIFAQKIVFGKNKFIINSGSYIGKNKYLIKMFKEILKKYGADNLFLDDQIIINHFIYSNNNFVKKFITIDNNYKIFANMSNVHSIYYLVGISKSNYKINKAKKKIINHNNGVSPSIISGCGNFNMSNYVNFLGYNTDMIIKREYKFFMIKNIINYFKTYLILHKLKYG